MPHPGVYLPLASPSEAVSRLPEEMALLGLQLKTPSLEDALNTGAAKLLESSQRSLAVLRQSLLGRARGGAVPSNDTCRLLRNIGVLAWVSAHATTVVKEGADVAPLVDDAYQFTHNLKGPPSARFCALTTRLKARDEALHGNYDQARTLLARVEKERDPRESHESDPAFFSDPIERCILNLCYHPEQFEKLDRDGIIELVEREILKHSIRLEVMPIYVQQKVASDFLWLSYHYARYPLLSHAPLEPLWKWALDRLSNDGEAAGILEAYRLLGAIALEHGEFNRAGDLFYSAAKEACEQGDSLAEIEFLRLAGEACGHRGGESQNLAVSFFAKAYELAVHAKLGSGSFFYVIELADALLKGWRVDAAKQCLNTINEALFVDAGNVMAARRSAIWAKIAEIEGDVEKAQNLLTVAQALCRKHDELGATDTGPKNEVVRRLDRLHAQESLPLAVADAELRTGALTEDELSFLATTLEQYLAKDRSPWIAELVFRLDLVMSRTARGHRLTPRGNALLQRPFELVCSYPKLLQSVQSSEVLLEQGLWLAQNRDANGALKCLAQGIRAAKHLEGLGDGALWACYVGSSLVHQKLKSDDKRAVEFWKLARVIELRLQKCAERASVRHYLDNKYKVSAVFAPQK